MYDLQAIHAQLQDRASPLFQAEQVLVRHLYRRLACLEGSGDPLFSLWRRELEFSYGDLDRLLSRNAKIQPQALWDLYGFGNEPGGSLIRLLESLQTFYSILIKLIARDMVGGALGSPLSALEEFQDILSGQFFIRSGIENYCYEDWYTWIIKYWDQDLSADCRLLAACLEQADQTASAEDYLKRFRSDSLRRIYETVFPREIRHALGEYYTPDWLAGQAVEDIRQGLNSNNLNIRVNSARAAAYMAALLASADAALYTRDKEFDSSLLKSLIAQLNDMVKRDSAPVKAYAGGALKQMAKLM